MPYDQNLAERIRTALQPHPGIVEKKMFGGVGFILHGNLACGVQGNDLIVRVGAENNDAALSRPFVRPFMAIPGKPMAGWILVSPAGITSDQDLQHWVEFGYEFTSTLPEKA
jgi:TfoX/Sxy family transcriptional regulator of competence genes